MLFNSVSVRLAGGGLLLAASLLAAAPGNDDFADRIRLPGTNYVNVTGDNTDATAEPDEPSARPNAAGLSVWWEWQPPADGSYVISTHGSTFDTVLAVYTGDAVNSLNLVADDDNGVSPLIPSAQGDLVVLTNASAAVTYKILVDGKTVGPLATSGGIALSIRPNNDSFASRITLSGAFIETTAFNGKAAKETGERDHVTGAIPFNGTPTPGKSLWWKWNAPAANGYQIATYPSTFPPVLAVYRVASTRQLSATITLTNVPVAGDVLTVNGDTRSWSAAPTNTAKQITLAGTLADCVTNLHQHVVAAPFSGPLTLASAPNGIQLTAQPAGALTVAASTNWATVAIATNFVQTNPNPQFNQLTKVATDTNTDWGGELDFDSKGNLVVFSVTNIMDDFYFAVDGQLAVSGGVTNVHSGLITLMLMPNNDQLAGATTITGRTVTTTAFNGRASAEDGEVNKTRAAQADPFNTSYTPQHSLWWKWQPPVSGPYIITTYGSPFNTFLGVLTNAANPPTIAGLSWARAGAASDDNGADPFFPTSLYALPDANSNQTYYIMADSAYDENADFYGMIKLSIRPDNNSVANRIVLTGTNAVSASYNSQANMENFEKSPPTTERDIRTIWWSWTAPAKGVVLLDTYDSSFATVMAVYTGTQANFSDYQLIDWSSRAGASGFHSELAFPTVPGREYKIQITGLDSSQFGEAVLRLSFDTTLVPPGDDFTNAMALEGPSALSRVTNTFASKETGEPNHAGNTGGRSIWWRWTAPGSGTVTITTLGSESYQPGAFAGLNTVLAVYRGSAINGLALVAANDEDPFFAPNSTVTFSATAGTTYNIAVDCGQNGDPVGLDHGVVTLSLEQIIVAPNDNFANRIAVTGLPLTVSGHNLNATKEAAEYENPLIQGGASVWWAWRAPVTGPVIISTEGTEFDTLLSVYTGTTLSTNNLALHSDAARPGLRFSRVTLNAVSNVVYNIAVEGQFEAQGGITLKFYPVMRLASANMATNGQFSLTFSSTPQFTYEIQYSTDLKTWDILNIISATTNLTTVVDADAVADDRRFYRIIEY